MALDSTIALISLQDAQLYLKISGTSEDNILNFLINEVSAMVNGFCGRHILQKSYTEYYDGDGSTELILKNHPLITLTSLHISDDTRTFNSSTLITNSYVFQNKASGILKLDQYNAEQNIFLKGNANIKIVYTAGYASTAIPYDIQQAFKIILGYFYQKFKNQNHQIQSINIGANTTTFLVTDLPSSAKAILNRYKARVVCPNFAFSE